MHMKNVKRRNMKEMKEGAYNKYLIFRNFKI